MAIYFKLKEKIFKSAGRIIIGRGAPFEILNNDRTIARAHVLLFNKQGKTFTKQVSNKAPVYVNGVQLKSGELKEVRSSDKIRFGMEELEILGVVKTDQPVTEIKRFAALERHPFYPYLIWGPLFSASAVLILLDGLSGERFVYIGFLAMAIISIVYVIETYFEPPTTKVTELYISEEGFTAHFAKGSNMTFKFFEIAYWWANQTAGRLDVEANGERFFMSGIEDLQLLEKTLIKKIPTKNHLISRPLPKNFTIIVLAFLLTAHLTNGVTPLILMTMVIGGALLMIRNHELREKYFFPDTFSFPDKTQKLILAAIAGIASLFFLDFYEKKKVQDLFNDCAKGVVFACKKAPFEMASRKNPLHLEAAIKACGYEVKKGCEFEKVPQKKQKALEVSED